MMTGGLDTGAEGSSGSSSMGHPGVLAELGKDSEVLLSLDVGVRALTTETPAQLMCVELLPKEAVPTSSPSWKIGLCKESACNAGFSLIPGSRRSPGEGISYPLQCSWTSLVAQMVKNPPAMKEIWV